MKQANQTLDRSDMRQVILREAEQFAQGEEVANHVVQAGLYDRVLVCGMGGSALPVEVLKVILDKESSRIGFSFPGIQIHRSYGLPTDIDGKTLVIACSHSGNTEETLSAFDEAIDRNLSVVGISSGGKLEARCREAGTPFVKLPIPFENFQPRMATGHFISALITLLEQAGCIPAEVREQLLASEERITTRIANLEEPGKILAERLNGKTPVIYASDSWQSLAMVWKIKINENGKTPAFWNRFPELNHNEMVGFTYPNAEFSFVLLRDPREDHRILRRYEVFSELFQEQGRAVDVLDIEGETVYDQVFSTLVLGDWTSYFLALLRGIDPTPVDMVEDFKKKL